MRVSAQTKLSTRQGILDAARELFGSVGFDVATTRDIAQAAGIAVGTLFNYFRSKEAIAGCLVMQQLPEGEPVSPTSFGSLEEAVFAQAATSLRQLKPCQKFVLPVLETTLSPEAEPEAEEWGQKVRIEHLRVVEQMVTAFLPSRKFSTLEMQMYWTLYLGVVTYWVSDKSENQVMTLALLDQSVGMFAQWIQSPPPGKASSTFNVNACHVAVSQ